MVSWASGGHSTSAYVLKKMLHSLKNSLLQHYNCSISSWANTARNLYIILLSPWGEKKWLNHFLSKNPESAFFCNLFNRKMPSLISGYLGFISLAEIVSLSKQKDLWLFKHWLRYVDINEETVLLGFWIHKWYKSKRTPFHNKTVEVKSFQWNLSYFPKEVLKIIHSWIDLTFRICMSTNVWLIHFL